MCLFRLLVKLHSFRCEMFFFFFFLMKTFSSFSDVGVLKKRKEGFEEGRREALHERG